MLSVVPGLQKHESGKHTSSLRNTLSVCANDSEIYEREILRSQFLSSCRFSRTTKLNVRIVKGQQKKEEEKKEGGERAEKSYYRIRSVALTTILVRNAIKRVIQVVIVIPLPRARSFFTPQAYTRES